MPILVGLGNKFAVETPKALASLVCNQFHFQWEIVTPAFFIVGYVPHRVICDLPRWLFNVEEMSVVRKYKIFFNVVTKVQQRNLSATSVKDEIDEVAVSLSTNSISCNKSGLLDQHRNVLHNKTPYLVPSSWIHLTEKYQRKVFGRYGSKSGVNPKICFSAKTSKSNNCYDKMVETKTLHDMINEYKIEENSKRAGILKREDEISKKMEKLHKWTQDLNARLYKKQANAIAAKERKDRLIEEVRRYFGYKIDQKDDRFKDMLEQKEREDRKKQKEEKRKAKEQKLMSKLVEKSAL